MSLQVHLAQGGIDPLTLVQINNPHVQNLDDVDLIIVTSDIVHSKKAFGLFVGDPTTLFLDYINEFTIVIGVEGAFKKVTEVILDKVVVGKKETLRLPQLPENLITLLVSECNMQTLDLQFCGKSIQELKLLKNAHMMQLVGLETLKNLTELYIRNNNRLIEVPSFSKTVQSLSIEHNAKVTRIPETLAMYAYMKYISVTDNRALNTTFLLNIKKYDMTFNFDRNRPSITRSGSPEV